MIKMKKCPNGHYYKKELKECPYCNKSEPEINSQHVKNRRTPQNRTANKNDNTVYVVRSKKNEPNTIDNEPTDDNDISQTIDTTKKPQSDNFENSIEDNEKTVGISRNKGFEPVVGWLFCVAGENIGHDFRLVAGINRIGRSERMHVVLNDDSVTRDNHFILVYDIKSNTYMIAPGDGDQLTYLNNIPILQQANIKNKDIIEVGRTKLMFISICDENFSWNNNKF